MSLLEKPTPITETGVSGEPPDEPVSSDVAESPDQAESPPPSEPPATFPLRGMRLGRLRIRSVAKIAAVFLLLGYVVTLATSVAVWSVLQRLGFVGDLESLIVSSLGVESFDIVGRDLFDLVVLGAGVVFAMGYVVLLLLTIVYNAACVLFGGLAFETVPVRGWRRHRQTART